MTEARALRSSLNATLKDSFSVLREHGREDVVELARQHARSRPALPRIVIVGETKRGKSTLTNALIGCPDLSPVGTEETSATFLTIVPDADDEPNYALVLADGGDPVRVPLAELPDHTDLARLRARGAEPPLSVEVHCTPGPVGAAIVVDTPGIGGLTSARGRLTRQLAADGGMILFVIDAGSPMSQPELDYLVECARQLEEIAVVVTMVDKYPHTADRIVAHLKGQLRAASPRLAHVPIFGVQAPAALASFSAPEPVRTQLFGVSGLEPLIDRIAVVAAQAALLGPRTGLRVARTGLGEIVTSLRNQATAAARSATPQEEAAEERRIEGELSELAAQRARWKLDFEGHLGRILQDSNELALRESRELERRMRETLARTPLVRRDAFLRSVNLDLLSELGLLANRVADHLQREMTTLLADLFGDADAPAVATVRTVDEPGTLARVKGRSAFDPMTVGMGFMAYGAAAKVLGMAGIAAAGVAGGALAAAAVLPWVAYGLVFKSNQSEKGQLQGELSRVVTDFRSRLTGQVNAWVREVRPEVLMAYDKVLNRRERELRDAQQTTRQTRALSAEERKKLQDSLAKRARVVMTAANKVEDALEQARISGTKPAPLDSDG